MWYVKNVPTGERVVRVACGAVSAGLALAVLSGPWAWIAAAGAVGLSASGLVGFCPMCAMVGRKLPGPGH
ncbi:DUF2892 domain-containing protein [Ideonella sp. DXS29W]|uniref:DUF2892 domain-containing protein n=1 Tax=Ideonella lacteola TaxID=2984193 RepID=A0ABU9BY94_9BURK